MDGWRRAKRGEEHDFTILKVREDQVVDPRTGTTYPRVQIDCPDWVNVLPVTPEGQVVFVRQFRFGIWSDSLELPGGMVDPGEAPATAAARELEEETGFVPGRIEPLGWIHPNPAIQHNRCHTFLARDCVRRHQGRPEASEDVEVELVDRARIPVLLREGKITHALVAVAFLWDLLGPGAVLAR